MLVREWLNCSISVLIICYHAVLFYFVFLRLDTRSDNEEHGPNKRWRRTKSRNGEPVDKLKSHLQIRPNALCPMNEKKWFKGEDGRKWKSKENGFFLQQNFRVIWCCIQSISVYEPKGKTCGRDLRKCITLYITLTLPTYLTNVLSYAEGLRVERILKKTSKKTENTTETITVASAPQRMKWTLKIQNSILFFVTVFLQGWFSTVNFSFFFL